MDNLWQLSQKLQRDAEAILKQLHLADHLSDRAEVVPVGSYTYHLMAWEDLDIDLVTESQPEDTLIWDTARFLSSQPQVKLLLIADNRAGKKEHNRPRSVYLGLKYDYRGTIWKVDIRLLSKADISPKASWLTALQTASDEQKALILKIKHNLKDDPRYHQEVSSVSVYKAVLEEGIDSVEAFYDTLSV